VRWRKGRCSSTAALKLGACLTSKHEAVDVRQLHTQFREPSEGALQITRACSEGRAHKFISEGVGLNTVSAPKQAPAKD
jgi:hypothetical protein